MPKKEESGFPFRTVIICSLISSVLFFMLLVLSAFIILRSTANESSYLIYGLVCGGVSAFVCGFIALKIIEKNGILYGAVCGVIQAFACSAVIFILNKGIADSGLFVLFSVIILLSSIGGVTGVNLKKKIKY